MFTREFHEQYVKKARTYPEGLVKLEPGDLADLTLACPPADTNGAYKAYREAVRVLASEGRLGAERVSREWTGSKVQLRR
jgi:hypothetical protein